MSAEIYIFSPRDEYLGTLTEENGLLKALLKDKLNNVSSEPLTIEFESDSDVAVHIKEEHRIVVRDREGKFREYVIKEEDDLNDFDGPISEVICFPSFMYELSKKIIVDRRFVDRGPEVAWQAALEGTRFEGEVIGSFGKATTNFYYLSSVEALWKTRDVWGGDIESIVELSDDNTYIERRIMNLRHRLGADRGARFEVGHNTKEIQRTVLSDPVTALYGRGASLEILDEDGNPTGGHTRYIDFGDVEWKKSNGDPVDKPKGQKWVGDPQALLKYGLEEDGQLIHLEDIYSNQNIEDEEELLALTWDHLQKAQTPEIHYKLNVELIDEYVELGDTAAVIDREFARPIEIQSRVIAIQYDLMDIEGTTEVEMGQHLTLDDAYDKLKEELEHIKESLNKPRPTKPIDEDSFPDIKPAVPQNFAARGAYSKVILSWSYISNVSTSHYELYASEVQNFIPQPQHMIWRGKSGGYIHESAVNKKWYYRLREVNYHGTASDFTSEISAETLRINADTEISEHTITKHLLAQEAIIESIHIGEATIHDAHLTGKISASRLVISRDTEFADGYDPTKIEIGGRNLIVDSTRRRNRVLTGNNPNGSSSSMGNFISDYIDVRNFSEITGSISNDIQPQRVLFINENGDGFGYSLTWNLVHTWKVPTEAVYVLYSATESGGNRYKLEKGNKATDWTPAPEDVQYELDKKAESDDLENLAEIVSDISSEVNFKAGMGEFEALQEAFNQRIEQDILDKEQLEADLATMEGRMTFVEILAGDAKLVTDFIDTVITESEEGIFIGNKANDMGVLVAPNRISFIDNGTEVAYISNQTMEITHGIFVESATISGFHFEKIPGTEILAITWVGD